jgi:hypothetical protein
VKDAIILEQLEKDQKTELLNGKSSNLSQTKIHLSSSAIIVPQEYTWQSVNIAEQKSSFLSNAIIVENTSAKLTDFLRTIIAQMLHPEHRWVAFRVNN